MSNILHLSKYNPFTLRYNLCNVSVLKENYRKRLCEIHTMHYNFQIFVVTGMNKRSHIPQI